jgi:hypothetical protein
MRSATTIKGCSTQQTCLCSIDIRKVTTQQTTIQCDLPSAMEEKNVFHIIKKTKEKKVQWRVNKHLPTCCNMQ